MNEEELLTILRENLSISIRTFVCPFGGPEIEVKLMLGDKEIASASDSVSTSWLKSDGEYY